MTEVVSEEFTIDELAARTGITVRNIRFYTEQGLLPSPERRGRVAYYGPQQRMRLELVKHLQDYGYTLSAIGQVLSRLPADATATDIALRTSLLSPWSLADLEEVDRDELNRRAGRTLSDSDVELLIALGAVAQTDEGGYKVATALLGATAAITELKLPRAGITAMAAVVDRHMTALANDLIDLMLEQLSASKNSGEIIRNVATVLPLLRPIAIQSVIRRFNIAIDRKVTQTVAQTKINPWTGKNQ